MIYREQGSALIITMIVLMVLSLLGSIALSSTNNELKLARNDKLHHQAMAIAEAGVEHGKIILKKSEIEKLLKGEDGDIEKTEDNGVIFTNRRLGEGEYIVRIEDNDDGESNKWIDDDNKIYIVSKGIRHNVRKTIKVLVKKESTKVDIDSALSIYTPDSEMEIKGASGIDGNKWEVPFLYECSGSHCDGNPTGEEGVPALYSENELDLREKGKGYDHLKPDYEPTTEGSGKYDNQHWKKKADYYIATADKMYTESVSPWDPLGTRDDPQVTIVNGGKLSGNVDGAGVLVLQNGAEISGSFHFEGLVIYKTSKEDESVNFFSSGTNDIFGGFIVTGTGSPEIDFTGNSKIKYSEKALNFAGGATSSRLNIVSWSSRGYTGISIYSKRGTEFQFPFFLFEKK